MPALIRIGDPVTCGDTMGNGSPNVYANNNAVSRVGIDLTAGHCYNPTPVSTGSPDVFVNNASVDRVSDPIIQHSCPGSGSHGGVMASGSPDVFVDN